MTIWFLFAIACYFFAWPVWASKLLFQDLIKKEAPSSKMSAKEVLKDMPASYFGFHFMIPLDYNNCIPGSVVRDLRSIFLDIRTNTNTLSDQTVRTKYSQVIQTLVSNCEDACKSNTLNLLPHAFFKVDETFCGKLQSQLINWFNFMGIFLPNRNIFIDAKLDSKSIRNIEYIHMTDEVEPKLGTMADKIFCVIEMYVSNQSNVVDKDITGMYKSIQVLSDISMALKLNLTMVKIIENFHARLNSLLTLFLNLWLPFRSVTPISNTALLGVVPLKLDSKEVCDFLSCRYAENLSISECARHVKFIGKSVLSLVELVNRIHAIQFQHATSSRAIQRFLTFLFKGLIREHQFSVPDRIVPNLSQHLLQKVPIYFQSTVMYDYSLYRQARREQLLPQIFSTYLKLKQPLLIAHFSLHYNFYDLARLNNCTTFIPFSFFLQASTSQDVTDFNNFAEIYNKFNMICQVKKYFFKSLFVENVDLIESFRLFLEELAGLDDPYEVLECIKQLALLYQKLCGPDSRWEPVLLFISSLWFDSKYLKDSSSINLGRNLFC